MPAVRAKDNLKLQLNTAAPNASSPTWTDIPGLKSLSGGGVTTDRIDVTAFDSPGVSKEYITGLNDPQPLTFDMNYKPGDTTQQALRTANINGVPVQIRLLLAMTVAAAEEAAVFSGLITKFSAPVGDPGKELVISCEITPSTAPVYALDPGGA